MTKGASTIGEGEPTLRDLRSFLAVVDEGTFTDAAIALGTTQASVSRHVAALERALGARLLNRGGLAATPTTAGRRALRHARALRTELEALQRSVRAEDREIRIGFDWAALGARTTTVQREWARRHPAAELVFVAANSRHAGITEGLADVAVVRREPTTATIGRALVGHEDRVAAVSSGHRLARKRRLRMADFTGETVAINTVTGTTTEELWTPGRAPGAFRRVDSTDEWLTLIAAGQAIGLTSGATAAQYARVGLAFRTVVDAPQVPVWLIWWREDPPWFIDELSDVIRAEYQRPE